MRSECHTQLTPRTAGEAPKASGTGTIFVRFGGTSYAAEGYRSPGIAAQYLNSEDSYPNYSRYWSNPDASVVRIIVTTKSSKPTYPLPKPNK
ncbi:hypothetical protein PENSUB_3790 [Penicillium subrubescens]|uniref:Uncharacterized protein n=1 Tax=Penicillium subrubescens TaxID=1316194 RepID=A0A1Q5UER4_9EURO|nr:hypothetical protein PENSUB_3790 [Penicillium subrubescens]